MLLADYWFVVVFLVLGLKVFLFFVFFFIFFTLIISCVIVTPPRREAEMKSWSISETITEPLRSLYELNH